MTSARAQPQQQQQQHQPHQRELQQQHAQTAHNNTAEATGRGTVDRQDDEDAAIARPVVDGAARRHQTAGRLTNNDTNEQQGQQRTQHNITLTRAQIPAVHNSTIQLVPRKTDESSDTSLMTRAAEALCTNPKTFSADIDMTRHNVQFHPPGEDP